ncbi:Probable RNA-directed DNA polymerase from transposon X-element [Eumeta japonica]|uniref:Probable RNA-directed DNA polymerase from transposon X-element n=1 Tax=Eumeta variegata TaxID=151549 RepID=A0A4C1UXR1_EUMVA|nr:Probable RNA-directed DNA polymerase from transposon X-element [Eumeta japonica]
MVGLESGRHYGTAPTPPPYHIQSRTDIVCSSGVGSNITTLPPSPSTHATFLRNRKYSKHEIARLPLTRGSPASQRIPTHSGRISPNWTRHFSELRKILGHPPNARPFKSGVRFLPATADEFRVTQRYLQSMSSKEPSITWYCYTPTNEHPTKVGVRGLPGDTNIQEILVALQQQDFPATNARRIPPRRHRSGCLFFVQLEHLNEEERERLYAVKEILNMPGVTVEAWRARPQCYRCQLFGHSSYNCHRPMRCVRCGGEHAAASCERPREEKPTCANCDGPHTTNDRPKRHCKIHRNPPPPKTQCDGGRQHHDRGKICPHTPHSKAETDSSPGTRGNHGTGTTGRGHRPCRTAAHRLRPPRPDSAHTAETEKGQEGEKEGKKDATTATTTAAATNRTEGDRSPPRGESEKSRRTPEQAALPNNATETATPTTAEADRETTTHPHHIRPGPGGGQSKSSHVRDDKDTHHNTPLNQDWSGSDTGHSGRPDTRGDVLNLRIIYWNPGGIIGKTRELRDLAQLEDDHIILLGETKLRPEQELKIPNFFAYRRDEISARGPAYRGTAVLIRRDIMHETEQLTDFETMRSIGIRVGSSEQEIRLFAAYRPPGTKMCVQDIHAIIQEQTPTLIIGDLHAKHKAWGSHSISRAGRLLMEDAECQGYEVLGPDTPTHVPTDIRHRPDVLDIVIGHKIRRLMHVEIMYGMDMQHLPILVTVGFGTFNSPPVSVRQRLDWKSFESSLETLHLGSSFETAADVEASANLLVEKIKEAQARATTLLPSSTSRRGDLPLSIKRKLRLKRRLHKLWTRTHRPKLKKELNGLSRNISEAVRDFRGANWEATIDRAGESAKNLNQLCRQLTRAAAPKCPITDRSGVRRYDAKARAEVIAEHLAEQFTPNPPATSPNLQKHHAQVRYRVEEFMATAPSPLPGDLFITPAALHKIVIRLPKKKAPGPDGVSTAALRHLPRRAIVAMNRVFNGILRTGHFPEEWKRGKIITLPKAGKDPRKPENIWPITLLSHVAKTFERALLTKLRLFLTPRQEQYGFREGHSTTLQLIRVLHYLA